MVCIYLIGPAKVHPRLLQRSLQKIPTPIRDLACLVLMCLVAPQIYSWSDAGHRVVCEIAAAKLDGTAQREVKRLLSAVPVAQARLSQRRSSMQLPDACVWPDKIRNQDAYQSMTNRHYINMARHDEYVNLGDCRQGCILTAIATHQNMLADTAADAWTRAQALMFLGHWLGDLHQPLHVSFADDRGGNKIIVKGIDPCKNLHEVWDFCLINQPGTDIQALAKVLNQAITTTELSHWLMGSPLIWAQESYDMVRQPRLRYCHQTGQQCLAIDPGKPLQLDESYLQEHSRNAKQRIQQAGVRLGHLLNRLLSETP